MIWNQVLRPLRWVGLFETTTNEHAQLEDRRFCLDAALGKGL